MLDLAIDYACLVHGDPGVSRDEIRKIALAAIRKNPLLADRYASLAAKNSILSAAEISNCCDAKKH